MLSYSDNDDGFAELTVTIKGHIVEGIELCLYDNEGNPCTFATYATQGGYEFADTVFQHHYKALLSDVGIELIEKMEVTK